MKSVWHGARRPQALIKGTAALLSRPDITASHQLQLSSRSSSDRQHAGTSAPPSEGALGGKGRPGTGLGGRGPDTCLPPTPGSG